MNRTRRGSTLIEVLLVLGIIGIIVALVTPNFLHALRSKDFKEIFGFEAPYEDASRALATPFVKNKLVLMDKEYNELLAQRVTLFNKSSSFSTPQEVREALEKLHALNESIRVTDAVRGRAYKAAQCFHFLKEKKE